VQPADFILFLTPHSKDWYRKERERAFADRFVARPRGGIGKLYCTAEKMIGLGGLAPT
jgi:hypothetical protein